LPFSPKRCDVPSIQIGVDRGKRFELWPNTNIATMANFAATIPTKPANRIVLYAHNDRSGWPAGQAL
jgi:hypothetical protein